MPVRVSDEVSMVGVTHRSGKLQFDLQIEDPSIITAETIGLSQLIVRLAKGVCFSKADDSCRLDLSWAGAKGLPIAVMVAVGRLARVPLPQEQSPEQLASGVRASRASGDRCCL